MKVKRLRFIILDILKKNKSVNLPSALNTENSSSEDNYNSGKIGLWNRDDVETGRPGGTNGSCILRE